MSGPALAPNTPRYSSGRTGWMMLVAIAVAALVAILVFAHYERRTTDVGTQAGLLQRGMSPGHRMLNQEAGRTLPSNAPRIQRADALITRVSTRFRLSKDKVVELALSTHGMIVSQQPEDVLDVLDAALFASEGLPQGQVPLAPVFAAYAKARLDGIGVTGAREIARSFAQVAAKDMDAPPRR
jgi:hypothetical protein